jgi:hypothetical protein
MKKDLIIEKQKELIITLIMALDFLADNNLIKERKDNNDADNKPLIDCVNNSARLRKDIKALESPDDGLYRKVYIKSENDLPKHNTEVLINRTEGVRRGLFFETYYDAVKDFWLNEVDFSGIDFIVVGALTGRKYLPDPAWHKSINHPKIYYKTNYQTYFPELINQ